MVQSIQEWTKSNLCLSRPYHSKYFIGCLPEILLGPFLNNLSHKCIILVNCSCVYLGLHRYSIFFFRNNLSFAWNYKFFILQEIHQMFYFLKFIKGFFSLLKFLKKFLIFQFMITDSVKDSQSSKTEGLQLLWKNTAQVMFCGFVEFFKTPVLQHTSGRLLLRIKTENPDSPK